MPDSLSKAGMSAECCQMLHAVVYFGDTKGRARATAVVSLTERRMNYEIIWLLSLDKPHAMVESKRVNVCDAVREPPALTFVWVYFNGHLDGHWVCVKSIVGFLLNTAMASLLMKLTVVCFIMCLCLCEQTSLTSAATLSWICIMLTFKCQLIL